MSRFLSNLLRMVVIAANVLPMNALLVQSVYAASAPPAAAPIVAEGPRLPGDSSRAGADSGSLFDRFVPQDAPRPAFDAPARPIETGLSPQPIAAPPGLSIAKPARLRKLAAAVPAPPAAESRSLDVLPDWFTDLRAGDAADASPVLPDWFSNGRASAATPARPAAPTTGILPGWFNDSAVPAPPPDSELLPAWFAPPAAPLRGAIPPSLLSVNILDPGTVSVGAPAGKGTLITAVIRNDSSGQTAYNVSLSAVYSTFFTYDGGAQVVSSTGVIAGNVTPGAGTLQWTPVSTLNLAPRDAITLTFNLRATCGAQSGQRLEVDIHYNNDPNLPPTEVNSGAFNITTGRGNLVIKKEPALQNLGTPDFGQPITWVVTVQNTGLGTVYSATVFDNGGLNLAPPTGLPDTIAELAPNAVKTYTVVGVVNSCNLANTAEAYWACGNLEGDALITNTVASTASVLFTPQLPNLSIQVSSPITFPYCDVVSRTVAVTVTNTGGPVANFRLDSTLESDSFLSIVPGSTSAGWQYIAAGGVFSRTADSGALLGNSVVTLTFSVIPTGSACALGSGDVTFTPQYNDVCSNDPFTGNPVTLNYLYAQDNAPTLNVRKIGPDVVEPGQTYTYQVVISGDNPGNISGSIAITDVLPPEFPLTGGLNATAGSAFTTGQTVNWSYDPPNTLGATFVQTLTYQIRVTDTVGAGACGASQSFANNVQAQADPTCPTCGPLTAADQVTTVVINNEGVTAGRVTPGSIETCGPGGFTLGANYRVAGATTVNWTGAVFTDVMGSAGADSLPGPTYLAYQPGSLVVAIETAGGLTDYSGNVVATTPGGVLRVDLSGLQALAPTQNFTLYLTYTAQVTDDALAGAVSQDFKAWHELYLPGVSDAGACTNNGTFNNFIPLNISRGDLQVSLDPPVLARCRINVVTLNVTGGDPTRVTDNVVVTFTASTAEIQSIIAHGVFTYSGGVLALGAPTVTNDPAIGGGRGVITFTFPAASDMDSDGEIQFLVDVPCSGDSIWNAGVTFRSQCLLPYGNTTAQPHAYQAPNLTLFVTPIAYTVRDKVASWRAFIANTGNYTAYGVSLTNVLSGISVYTYTVDDPAAGVTLSGALPITAPNPVVLTVDTLAPGQQLGFAFTGTIFTCTPLSVTVQTRNTCFGETCNFLSQDVHFDTPDPYLLTNNGQTADLPTCDIGHVVFTTKNASPDVNLYDLTITETLESLDLATGQSFLMTITNETGAIVATTTNFSPITQTAGAQTILVWKAISAPTEVLTYFQQLPPLYIVKIDVPVRTGCTTALEPKAFAEAAAKGPCDNELSYQENAVTLRTRTPNLSVEKTGKVAGGDFGDTVVANPGDQIVWRLIVRNIPSDRSYKAKNVVLTDTWPAEFTYIGQSNSGGYIPTILGSNTISWSLGDLQDDGVPYTFYITGTIPLGNNVCTVAATNTTRVTFGCDYNGGCTGDVLPEDTARLVTGPDISVDMPLDPLLTCGGPITVTLTNRGAAAYSSTLTVTVPAGYAYSQTLGSTRPPDQIITGTGQAPVWVWNPITIPGRSTVAPFDPYVMNLSFVVQTTGTTGICPIPDAQIITATLQYNDAPNCTVTGPFSDTFSGALNVLTPSLQLDKQPTAQVASVTEVITWAVTLRNTGAGDAPDNIIITDTVGTNFNTIQASAGSDGSVPVTRTLVDGRTVITWQVLSSFVLQANSANQWQAIITATVGTTGTNRNEVEAKANCDGGCRYTNIATDTAFVTVQDKFIKTALKPVANIGDLVTFTLQAELNDQNGLYSNLIITDALPAGLGYVSATLVYTADGDGGGTGTPSDPPTVTPNPLQTGNIVWRLGDVPGTLTISATVFAMALDDSANQNGVPQTNQFLLSYEDDGGTGITQTFSFTDSAPVEVKRPVLHIQKTYLTDRNCDATLFEDNFNDGNDAGWSTFGAWTVTPKGTYTQTGEFNRRRAAAGDTAMTDYSYSFMARTLDPVGEIGGYVRHQGGTSDLGYLFRWTNTQMRLDTRNGVGGIVLLDSAAGGYQAGQWYHIEMRAVGDLIEVFVDGQRVLSATDATYPNGGIALFTHRLTGAEFDDVLVTRLGDSSCFVGAGDLVTYTLTISSHESLPGYNLVITDNMPAELDFIASAWRSTDPESRNTYSPTVGATAPITWGFNQLTGTGTVPPLTADQQTLVITVTTRVSDGVAANTYFSNQAFLIYQNRNDGGLDLSGTYSITTRTVATDSGGSHSTGLQTVNGGIAKTVVFSPPPTATLGTLVTYTLIVPASPITATFYGVVITDQLQTPLFYIHNVTAGGGVNPQAGFDRATGLITATFDSIPHDTQARITVTTRISHEYPLPATDPNSGDVITNAAVMSHATASEITRTNTVTTEVGEPSVQVGKVAQSSNATLIDQDGTALLTYTIRLTNSGNSPAYSVHIDDNLPAGISVTAQFGGDARSGPAVGPGVMTWTVNVISNVVPNNTLDLTYTARISKALADSWLTNTVDIRYTSLTETIPGVRPYTDSTTEQVDTPLPSLLKRTTPITLRVGDVVTYNLVFTIPAGIVGMGGNSYLVDTLPPGLNYVIGSEDLSWTPGAVAVTITNRSINLIGGAQVITWTFGQPITSLQSIPTVITVSFQARAVGEPGGLWPDQTIVYTVVDTATLIQRGTPVDTDTVQNKIIQPRVTLRKDSDPPPGSTVGLNSTITYTVIISNDGLAPAYDIVLTDTLPTGLAFSRTLALAVTDPATATLTDTNTAGDTTLTWGISQLNVGGFAFVTFTARVSLSIGGGGVLTNAAFGVYDSQPGDKPGERDYPIPTDTVPITTPVFNTARPVVQKSSTDANGGALRPGDRLTYTLVVSNEGNLPATNVTITDTVPANTTYLPGTISGGDSRSDAGLPELRWGIATLPPASPVTLTFAVIITYPLTDSLSLVNVAGITSTEVPTPTTDTVTDTITADHSLQLSKSVTPTSVSPGGRLTYTLRYTVAGDEPVFNLTISDTTPANTTFVAATPAPASAPAVGGTGRVVWQLGNALTATSGITRQTGLLTLVVQADSPLTDGLSIRNTASITDSEMMTDTDSVTTPVAASHTLALLKSAAPAVVMPGDLLTYSLRYTVAGNGIAPNVTLSDTTPASTTFVSALPAPASAPAVGGSGLVLWQLGNIAPPSGGAVTMVVRVDAAAISGTTLLNAAIITDSQLMTDTGSVTTPVTGPATSPQLVIGKRSSAGGTATPGQTIRYSLAVTNTGTGQASNVTISDTVPPDVSFVAASPAQASGPNPLVWQLGTLLPGNSTGVVYTVTVNGSVTSGLQIVNTAAVTSTEIPTPTTDTVTDTVALPGVQVVKRVTVAPTVASATVRYTLDVTNTGAVPIFPVSLTDTMSVGLTFVPGTFSPISPTQISNGGQTLYWANVVTQPLQPGQNLSVWFDVRVTTAVTGTYFNSVTATGTYPGGTVTDTDSIPIDVRDPTVDVVKGLVPPGAVNGLITFTISVTNTGPSTLTTVPLFDYFAGPVVYAGGTPPADTVDNANGLLVWNDLTTFYGNMAPGQRFVVTTAFSITSPDATFTMTNMAVVTDATDEHGNDANEDDDTVDVINAPTAVDLLYFTALGRPDGIVLRWATAVEVDNYAFRLLRSQTGQLTDAAEIALIPGQGLGTGSGASYEYVDGAVHRGETYTYWLVDIDLSGHETVHGPRVVVFSQLNQTYLPLILKE